MDLVAINALRTCYGEALRAAETYRDAAEAIAPLRDFYHALSVTYERAAREMEIMLDTVERLNEQDDMAA